MIALIFVLTPSSSFAWAANITFTAPIDPTYITVVLVSETSGDYSESFGQRSEPGANTVDIGNIKPETTYYFIAYRLVPGTWERSPNSEEISYTTGAYAEPIVKELPPIMVGGDIFKITIEVNP